MRQVLGDSDDYEQAPPPEPRSAPPKPIKVPQITEAELRRYTKELQRREKAPKGTPRETDRGFRSKQRVDSDEEDDLVSTITHDTSLKHSIVGCYVLFATQVGV